jgi:hypothetical protein
VVTVSLDESRVAFNSRFRELRADWPTHFDGLGWGGTIPRSLGINALPTVFVIDKRGVLRSINARASYETWIRQLLSENLPS